MPGAKGRSGGRRPGAGRPPKPKFKSPDMNEFMIFQQEEIGGDIQPDKPARIVGISDNEIEWQVGDTIYVLRRPDENEVI